MKTLRLVTLLAVAAGAFALAPAAHAATITVNTTADELNMDGDCSLREAIGAANTNLMVDACTSGAAGEDTVVVPAGTFTLAVAGAGEDVAATGDLDLTQTVVIRGANAETTIVDGADLDRVFDVTSAGVTARLEDLTVRNGSVVDGGGIRNAGTLTLTRVTVSGNQATADAGGILNAAPAASLTVTASTVSGNTSGETGGGLATDGGTVTIRNSTISGNQAECSGGGILLSNGTTVTLNNVTIAENVADANPPPPGACGAENNGGGISIGAGNTVNVSNTIIGANRDQSSGSDARHPDCSGTIASQGFNLIQDTTGCTISGTTTGNVTGQNPQLSPLADNGGTTQTHALRQGSDAVDAGNPVAPGSGGSACEAADQRGVNRPEGPRCDIGAFEREGGGPAPGGPRCLGRPVTLDGTTGNDRLTGTAGPDSIRAKRGNDSVSALPRSDTVCGGPGADSIRGGPGPDRVSGQADDDRTGGGPGPDSVSGNAGNDRLRGARGRDRLHGGAGNDILGGGPGFDVCRGGPGTDRFRRCERRIQ
jgi:CSLREA domain-containing protein